MSPMAQTNLAISPRPSFPPFLSTSLKLNGLPDTRLDRTPLEMCCPIDIRRRDHNPTSTILATSRLEKLHRELLNEVLLQLDILSLVRFWQVNRFAMHTVGELHEYSTIISHCPNVVRAIICVRADAYDCRELYRTLSTSRCSNCDNFGDYLYLNTCRRVCYSCCIDRPEYLPVAHSESSDIMFRLLWRFRKVEPPPCILTIFGFPSRSDDVSSPRSSLRLYDRQTMVAGDLANNNWDELDEASGRTLRFMTLISAPVFLNGGQQVETGFFCLACNNSEGSAQPAGIKYLISEIAEHIARYGPVEMVPGNHNPPNFMHVTKDETAPST